MSEPLRTSNRMAVLIANRFGWLPNVKESVLRSYLAKIGAAFGNRKADAHFANSASGPWTISISPQFYRSLDALKLDEERANRLAALASRFAADPRAPLANYAGIRSVLATALGEPAQSLPSLRIVYILVEEAAELLVLAALPTGNWSIQRSREGSRTVTG